MKTVMKNRPRSTARRPAYNVKNTSEYVLLEMAVPGHTREMIDISFEDGTLSLKSSGVEERDNGYVRQQFSVRPFEMTFTLGKTLDPGKIEASLDNGMLTIKIMKREEIIAREKKRSITVS